MRCLFVIVVGILLAAGLWAAAPDRPYRAWGVKDAEEILYASPWSCCCTWISPYVAGSGEPAGERLEVYVQLFSSHPIRQAVAVVAAAGDERRLDRWQEFATRNFDDEIVIAWIARSEPQGSGVLTEFMNQLRRLSLAELQQNTFLATPSGGKVPILDYLPPTPDGSGAKFIFPRNLPNGTPLVTVADHQLVFQTKPLALDLGPRFPSVNCKAMVEIAPTREYVRELRRTAAAEFRITATFSLKKLQYQGKTDY
ncbi:MAG: hypothetical protein JXQ27_14555 [Acidobacteria bacterium]|nr:hypothetical protein [Acidobacteriota bacterium]